MRRRRRRGQALNPKVTMAGAIVAAVALLGGFFYFVSVADGVAPEQTERRIELPDAFKS